MRIGIDIDDTITDSWPSVMEIMCRDFNRDVNEVISSKLIYEKITGLSFDDYLKYSSHVFPVVLKNAKLKDNVIDVLNKLIVSNEIYFITARLDACYGDAYKFSKDFLDRSGVPYTGIIANTREKGIVCKNLGIDLFIDDSKRNCEDVSSYGIPVIMFGNYFNSDCNKFHKIYNWNELLEEGLCKKDCSKMEN